MSKNPVIFIKIGNLWCKIRSCSDRPSADSAILNSSTDMQGMMYGRRSPILKGTSKQQTIKRRKKQNKNKMFRITFLKLFRSRKLFVTDKQIANFERTNQNQSQIIGISFSFLKIPKK